MSQYLFVIIAIDKCSFCQDNLSVNQSNS